MPWDGAPVGCGAGRCCGQWGQRMLWGQGTLQGLSPVNAGKGCG